MPTTSKEGAWPKTSPSLSRSGHAGVETARGAVARAELQSQPHSGSDSPGIARLPTCAQEALGAGIHAPPDPVPPTPRSPDLGLLPGEDGCALYPATQEIKVKQS